MLIGRVDRTDVIIIIVFAVAGTTVYTNTSAQTGCYGGRKQTTGQGRRRYHCRPVRRRGLWAGKGEPWTRSRVGGLSTRGGWRKP